MPTAAKMTIRQALEYTGFDLDRTAAITGAGIDSIRNKMCDLRRAGKAPPLAPKTAPKAAPGIDSEFGIDSGTVTTRSADIRTLDQALAAAKVDLSVWEVERHIVNSWETTMGAKPAKTGRPETYTNFQVKVWLRRIGKGATASSIEALISKGIKPVVCKFKPKVSAARNALLEISLYDAHFGAYSWGQESGESYDLKIAEQRYLYAVEDLLEKTSKFNPELILLPLGQDFLHINDATNTTPHAHNHLDVDTRLPKVLETAERAVIAAVDLCAQRAPVHLCWVPGNHDFSTSYYLARIIAARFHGSKHVTVDTGPKWRKTLRYGNNLLMFTHGNEEPHNSLPAIMAAENPADFGAVKTREVHLGHFHKRKEVRYNAADTFNGVVVRTLPSLCATDAWHHRRGYTGGNRAADAFLFDKQEGFIGSFTSWARA